MGTAVKRYSERERFYEIIGGKKYMPPSPVLYHHDIIYNLQYFFKNILRGKNFKVFGENVDVILDAENTVQPDLKIVGDFSKIADGKNIKGAPDFIVEVLSPGSVAHDLITKKDLYQKNGVKEYWIVDIGNKNVHVYLLFFEETADTEIFHYFTPDEIKDIEKDFDDRLKEQVKIKEITTYAFGEEIRVPIEKIFENI
jgi:Uma2 family endonuclease